MSYTQILRFRTITHNLTQRYYSESKNPFNRTWNIISEEATKFLGKEKKSSLYPEHADIVVIGGGIIGSAIAHSLKARSGPGLSVVVIEKDLTYNEARRSLSFGALNQHFSLPENMLLSQHGANFFRNIKQNFESIDIDVQFCPNGHLVLASEQHADKLEQNVMVQKEFGIHNELLTSKAIKERYPWINIDDIKLGSIGSEAEGQFNSWSFLKHLVWKAQQLDALYVGAEVIGFEMEQQRDVLMEGVAPGSFYRISKVKYRSPDEEEHQIKFACCILAAGGFSGEIATMAGIGTGPGLLSIPLPVKHRKNKVFSLEENNTKFGINTPFIMDTSGMWLRKNGLENNLTCGNHPLLSEINSEETTENYFSSLIQPALKNRFPSLNNAKVQSEHIEWCDCNSYDDTGIIGPHPYHNNFYLATGFGNLGYQHAPGIGRAITELIIDSQYVTIDLTRFGFDRLITDHPMVENNVY